MTWKCETAISDFVALTPFATNHNKGRLKRGMCGLTLQNPQYKLNAKKIDSLSAGVTGFYGEEGMVSCKDARDGRIKV